MESFDGAISQSICADVHENIISNIEINIDSNDKNYNNIINTIKNILVRLKEYKNELEDIKNELQAIKYESSYEINNKSFSIMSEINIDINTLYKDALDSLRTRQIRLFDDCLPYNTIPAKLAGSKLLTAQEHRIPDRGPSIRPSL